MQRLAPSDDRDSAAPDAGATGVRRAWAWRNAPWVRASVVSVVVVATLAGVILLAYQLALARVPQHRATLERLVQAQTGLDMRFNEIGLRWGWYGPEVVFRRVELGEPGRSNALLRAAELVVGFDAWRTLQSGQLQAGRITLIAPDIDLVRIRSRERLSAAPSAAAQQPWWNRTDVLQRWPRGRVDVEGGTLRLPYPAGSAEGVSLKIRRASLRRSDDVWNASANVFLPERLGRTARVSLRLQGDSAVPKSLRGSLQIDGSRLVFAGWRELLESQSRFGAFVPVTGGGDLTVALMLREGRITASNGSVRAGDTVFRSFASESTGRDFALGYLRAEWKAERRENQWRITADDLAFGDEARSPLTSLTLNIGNSGARVDGKLEAAPVQTLIAAAQWLVPDLELRDARLEGEAHDITFDWLITRPVGEKLNLAAQIEDLALSAPSLGLTFSGMSASLSGSETAVVADIEGSEARLELARAPETPLENLKVATRLQLQRTESAWELATEQLSMENEDTKLLLSGGIALQPAPVESSLRVRGTLEQADVLLIRQLLGEQAPSLFGSLAARLTGGRIERGQFEISGKPSELPFSASSRFSGSLKLRDATLAARDQWPEVQQLDAQLKWQGPRVQATVERGTGGPFELVSLSAEWQADGKRPPQISGQARGKLENVTAWLTEHPDLFQFAPQAQSLAARGVALFNFETVTSVVRRGSAQQAPHVRVAAVIDGASVQLAHLPPIEALRGSLSFEAGRLQRSTLTASWLGGPVTLRVSQQQDRTAASPGLAVQAEGTLNAQQLASAIGIEEAGELTGRTDWKGALKYTPGAEDRAAVWQARAETTLMGLGSALPTPLSKPASTAMPLHLEFDGIGDSAGLHMTLGERVRSAFELSGQDDGTWQVRRGTLRFGEGSVDLPLERTIELHGNVEHVDLPVWLAAWRRIEREAGALPLRADLSIDELLVAGRTFTAVSLDARRAESGRFEMRLDGSGLSGVVRWPGVKDTDAPVEARFANLSLPERTRTGELGLMLAALGPQTQLSVERFLWEDRPLGRLDARIETNDDSLTIDELRLESATHEAQASVSCKSQSSPCLLSFELNSTDAAATLQDFGFREELTAARASLSGELEWPAQSPRPWLEAVRGKVSMVLANGRTRAADKGTGRPLALLTVPALLHQSAVASVEGSVLSPVPVTSTPALAFNRLEATFDLRDGNAFTSNLHFDGDAEILMRGRVGLVTRDYDQVAWVLRGEDRLPSAVRRFGATPRVAAAWLALRDLVAGPDVDHSRAVMHLGGTWDAPVVGPVPTNESPGRVGGRSP